MAFIFSILNRHTVYHSTFMLSQNQYENAVQFNKQNTQNPSIYQHSQNYHSLPPIQTIQKPNPWKQQPTGRTETKNLITSQDQTNHENTLLSCFHYFIDEKMFAVSNEILRATLDKKLKRYMELKLSIDTRKFEDAIALVQ